MVFKHIVSAIIAFAVYSSFIITVTLCTAAENGYYHTATGAAYGDINSDEKVNLPDLILLRKHLAKLDVMLGVPNDTTTAPTTAEITKPSSSVTTVAPTSSPETTQTEGLSELCELSITTSQIKNIPLFALYSVCTCRKYAVYRISSRRVRRVFL